MPLTHRPCRPLPTLALCAAALLPLAAAAQDAVRIGGILDLAARSVSNEGTPSVKSMVSGSNATSRIFITGSEDLGGGMLAGYHLEHGILADTGAQTTATKFWDRRSTVSLSSKSLGELRLGRDFVPSYNVWSRHDPFSYVGVARSANLVSATPVGPIRSAFGTNANTTVRSDNALQVILPSGLGGWEGGLMLALGEGGAVASGLAKVIGYRLGYADQRFRVAAATTSSENSQTTAGKFRDSVVGGGVDVGNVKLRAAWREFKYGTSRQTLTMLAATTTFGVQEVKFSWTKADLSGNVGTTAVGANDATQWGLGYVYNLSRRTALYASVAQVQNAGAARFVISGGAPGIVAGGSSRGYEAGISHRF